MLSNKWFSKVLFALSIAAFYGQVHAYIDFCKFSATPKHPTLTRYNGGKNEISTLMFGSLKEDESVEYVQMIPKNMETLVPIRWTISFADANVVVDRKYYGYREPIGQALASTVQFFDLMPERQHPGTPFVDEYNLGIPSWWVFNNVEQLRSFTKYLIKHFDTNNLVASVNKPTVIIEIADQNSILQEGDVALIKNYYDVLDLNAPAVREFCHKAQDAFTYAKGLINKPRKASQKAGEMIFESIEKQFGDFKTQAVIAQTIKYVALSIIVGKLLQTNEVQSIISARKGELSDFWRDHGPAVMTSVKLVGGSVALLLLYNVINKHVLQESKKAKKIEENENKKEVLEEATAAA